MNVEPRPWYREPLVWLVIGLPAAAVVGGFITLYLAVHGADLVLDEHSGPAAVAPAPASKQGDGGR